MSQRWWRVLVGVAVVGSGRTLQGQTDSVAPFRMIGNIYYVGGSDIATYLIVTSGGLILLDGGYQQMVTQDLTNIRALGFDPATVKILLNSHAHYDHAGAFAELKRITGAVLYAGRGDSTILAHGGRHDFGFGDRFPFPPVTVDHPVADGDSITLGGTTIHAIATPGHTQGCTTWSMTVREGGRDYAVLFICSLSIPGYDLRRPPYPTIVDDYRSSIARLRGLRCDVFLAPHASMFSLSEKMARLKTVGPLVFVDADGCRRYLDGAAEDLRAHLNN